ncbi:hypothetical protein EDB81DRAFT_810992 [Dactylonectria macrodidyma]|uniref:Uncharacterized protein n=1 Tax=Dactylonectria macrodidyma TaxID=307937 RepID=A0A9P9DPV4_9HYPO|nr:hypothetical protein EDB81DRAFT_810992 [Dactylonectria macrodidyma]
MSTADTVIISETTTAGMTDGDSCSQNALIKGSRRLIQPISPYAKRWMLTCLSEQKKKQTKKASPCSSVRYFPCRPCVTRAIRAPGHEYIGTALRATALRAAQQLRACGSSAAPPAALVLAPALDSFGEVLEKSLKERKVIALEAIAGAARLWVQLIQQAEDDEEEDKDN